MYVNVGGMLPCVDILWLFITVTQCEMTCYCTVYMYSEYITLSPFTCKNPDRAKPKIRKSFWLVDQ